MTAELNSNLVKIFSGTYGTIWGDAHYEVIKEDWMYCHLSGNQASFISGYQNDWDDFMKSIVSAYKDKERSIADWLGVDFVKSIEITGGYDSPRQYNFSTDVIDFNADIDKDKLFDSLEDLRHDKEFRKWLQDKFTSRDGFISFTPSTYKGIYRQVFTQGEEYEQSIGALITYLGKLDDVEEMIFEHWRGNH